MKQTFKFFTLLAVTLFVATTFVSCSDDDDDNGEQYNNSIVGTWMYKDAVVKEMTTNATGEATESKLKEYLLGEVADDNKDMHRAFKADGTFVEYTTDQAKPDDVGTYTFENGVLTLLYAGGPLDLIAPLSFNASIENGVLTIDEDYKNHLNWLELDQLMAIGITNREDLTNLKTEKAIVAINNQRVK